MKKPTKLVSQLLNANSIVFKNGTFHLQNELENNYILFNFSSQLDYMNAFIDILKVGSSKVRHKPVEVSSDEIETRIKILYDLNQSHGEAIAAIFLKELTERGSRVMQYKMQNKAFVPNFNEYVTLVNYVQGQIAIGFKPINGLIKEVSVLIQKMEKVDEPLNIDYTILTEYSALEEGTAEDMLRAESEAIAKINKQITLAKAIDNFIPLGDPLIITEIAGRIGYMNGRVVAYQAFTKEIQMA